MRKNKTRDIARDIATILRLAINSRLPRGEYSAYKGVREAYALILLSCLIFTSMFADGLLSGNEAFRSTSINGTVASLGLALAACRLLIYIVKVMLTNKSLKVYRISSYAAGLSFAASGYGLAAKSSFISHIAESMGVGRLLFLYAYGFLFAMLFARIFEIIICVTLAKIEKTCEGRDGAI